jgi:hypothetical protein
MDRLLGGLIVQRQEEWTMLSGCAIDALGKSGICSNSVDLRSGLFGQAAVLHNLKLA